MRMTNETVFQLDVTVYDVDVMNELESGTELNHQLADVTLRIRVLVISHVTIQITAALDTTTSDHAPKRPFT